MGHLVQDFPAQSLNLIQFNSKFNLIRFNGTLGVGEPKQASNLKFSITQNFHCRWNLPNSILFTMTTLTMIGYGHISPQ